VVERAVDPVDGIPALVEFLSLAKIRELLDAWRSEYLDRQARLAAITRKVLPLPPLPDPETRKRVTEGFKKLSEHLTLRPVR
jgi:hypothetical protein